MIRARIIGTGHYLPEKILTNLDLESMMDTSDEWIRQRTGIIQRHIAPSGCALSDMAVAACRNALSDAAVDVADVDYVMCATCTSDYLFPSTSCIIQHELGIKGAGAVDLNAACSGFLYGVNMCDALIRAGVYKTILLVGAEILSVRTDYTNRNTAVLFGDGAGAVIIQACEGDRGVIATYNNADGSAIDMLCIPAGGTREPVTSENVATAIATITMDGKPLYKRAVAAFKDATEQALARAGCCAEDLDLFIPHQANKRIIDSACQRLNLKEEQVYLNVDRVANTSAASIPIALDQARTEGRIKDGSLLLMAAFGAGLTWGSAVVRW